MSTTRLTFCDVTATDTGIVIGRIEIIDSTTGHVHKVAKMTHELVDFISRVEIDIDAWYDIERMKVKNPAVTKLCSSFKLYT